MNLSLSSLTKSLIDRSRIWTWSMQERAIQDGMTQANGSQRKEWLRPRSVTKTARSCLRSFWSYKQSQRAKAWCRTWNFLNTKADGCSLSIVHSSVCSSSADWRKRETFWGHIGQGDWIRNCYIMLRHPPHGLRLVLVSIQAYLGMVLRLWLMHL